MARHLLLLAVALVVGTPLHAQTVRGVVSERVTYAPIDGATVTLIDLQADTLAQTLTDEQGFYSLDAGEEGQYFLIASALGYRSVRSNAVSLEDGAVRIVEMDMAPQPIPVSGLLVETEGGEPEIPGLAGTGFYDRWADGWGEYLTPGEILAHPAEYTHQLFRELQTIEFVRTDDGPTGPFSDRIMMRSATGGWKDLCEPLIYIDDIRTELMPGESLHDAAPRDDIEAIELHPTSLGAPLRYFEEFTPDACGVILIWMR
ncbi:MAG: carboxypeptidase-like regulatory domain-containing protein [Gemmatimonadetes bacterium]|nr:carboxypeptidase-like regulatory domain-containing protein [Gemmatimonadota bacterium]